MKKKIINSIIIYLCLFSVSNADDKKQVSFITSVGNTLYNSQVNANNRSYMSGMRVVGRSSVKSGNIWVTTVKIVPKY